MQLELDLNLLQVFIEEEYLTDIAENLDIINEQGHRYRNIGSIDHPSFTLSRNWLHNNGYIQKQSNWINGDIVVKDFYLNEKLFTKGEKFPCAAAIKLSLNSK